MTLLLDKRRNHPIVEWAPAPKTMQALPPPGSPEPSIFAPWRVGRGQERELAPSRARPQERGVVRLGDGVVGPTRRPE